MKRIACILTFVFAMLLPFAYAFAAESSDGTADEAGSSEELRFYWSDFVNAGVDTGYAESNEVAIDDPHFGWNLGRFTISGYTRDMLDNSSEPQFIKEAGSAIVLAFELAEDDIDHLHGNENLSVSDDTNGYDRELGIDMTDFGRGTMIVKRIDYHDGDTQPIVFTDYLSAEPAPEVKIEEEGDYVAVFDYELVDKSKLLFDRLPNPMTLFAPAYRNYRISLNFSVRNSDCMVYPFDIETGEELVNCSYTAAGFRIDTAKSPFLTVDVKHEVLHGASGSLVADPRSNSASRDGAAYEDEGVYTITSKNAATGLGIEKTIYVGDNALIKSYAATGMPLDELKKKVAGGAIIAGDGTVFDKGEDNWTNPSFLDYIGDLVYDQVVDEVGEGIFVEDVQVQYLSKEYLETMAGNSRSNEYFGLTAAELDEAIAGDRFVLAPGTDGKATVREFQPYDDSTERIIKNVAVGGGVILVCVAVSAATGGVAAPSCVAVIASSAAEGAIGFSLMSGAIGGVAAGVAKGYETGDIEQALKAAALEGSEEFKLGAITGALFGAGDAAVGIATKAAALKGAKLAQNISVKDAAVIQQAAKTKKLNWSKDTIKELSSLEEANVYLEAELKELNLNGQKTLVTKKIDWKLKDKNGVTNAKRLEAKEAPIEKNAAGDDVSFEVHHVGQKNDSMFAVMKWSDHRGTGNNKILHPNRSSDVEHGSEFEGAKKAIFEGIGKAHGAGLI